MKQDPSTAAWQLYEAGKAYKRRIGLYETVRRNEKFYRGEQWTAADDGLPRPVFNIIRRILDHLIGAIAPQELSVHYTDDRLPFLGNSTLRDSVSAGLELLNRNAAYRFTHSRIDELSGRALLDAALTGDGIFYCWWDNACLCGQPFCGDIRTDLIRSTGYFPADPTLDDVQSQEWILLSGRAPVTSLRKEAEQNGMSHADAMKIQPDTEPEDGSQVSSEQDGKATYLLLFRRENGQVVCEKSTRTKLLRRTETGLRHYPIARFHWIPTRDSCHGTSPVSEMIPNQRYINAAYAMVMKHMTDTAFSKIIYDKSRIPEWSNEVGEAIAAMGGGNVADAVSVVGVGQLEDGYLELINSVVENTKGMMGATESALGDAEASNTSAILALQQASRIGLGQVSARFNRCLGELAEIWADMLCAYSPQERLLPVREGGGVAAYPVNYRQLREELLHATAETGSIDRFTPSATVSLLDRLLERGHITVTQYLEHLPDGCITDRNSLLRSVEEKGKEHTDE